MSQALPRSFSHSLRYTHYIRQATIILETLIDPYIGSVRLKHLIEGVEGLFELVLVPLSHVTATGQRMSLDSQHILWPLSDGPGYVLTVHFFG